MAILTALVVGTFNVAGCVDPHEPKGMTHSHAPKYDDLYALDTHAPTYLTSTTCRFVIVPSAQDEEDAAAAAAMAKADELRTSHSDDEHGRRNGPRQYQQRPHRKKRRSQRTASAGVVGGAARRRSRSSASANASGCTDSEDSEGEVEEEPSGTRRGRRTLGGARGIGISEVTFFTHLKFSAHLPDFQEMEACRHFVGPLHILQVCVCVVFS